VSWRGLINILRENAQVVQDEQRRPPLACPNDGEPLEDAIMGTRHCRFDGFLYPDDWIPPGR